MKTILLAALNSQYVHTNLAVRSLAACCGPEHAPEIREYHVNQPSHWILDDLLQRESDIIGFSCYIWNIEPVLRIARDIKAIRRRVKILLGGPEVSFDAMNRMRQHDYIDYILCGEGEETLPLLLKGTDLARIPGLVYREKGTVTGSETYQRLSDLKTLPGPWTEETLALARHQIIYYESSRGCPFSCAFCLSGAVGGGVRERPLRQVQSDLAQMAAHGVSLVKFVDRTFNANPERAKILLRWMLDHTGDMRIHLELAADLLDEELLTLFASAPKGKIQIEAGVQSCNESVLDAIARKTDLRILKDNVKALIRPGKVHVHLDLIAGLPHEDFDSFARSFDEVYALSPHRLQLGFLKLLKGSELSANSAKYGVYSRHYPPYEVLYTRAISAGELLILKGIEELLERYYNSGRALRGLDFAMAHGFKSPFDFYYQLYDFCHSRRYLSQSVGGSRQLEILTEFAECIWNETLLLDFLARLRLDFLSGGGGAMPKGLQRGPLIQDETRARAMARQLLREERITQRQFKYARFDILPIRRGNDTIQDTLVMADRDRKDAVTGLHPVTVWDCHSGSET